MAKEIAGRLSTNDLAALWNLNVGTLRNWRAAKPRKGPRFIKIGGSVRYMMRDVVAYERRRAR